MHIQRFTHSRLADSTRIAGSSASLACEYGVAVVQRMCDEMVTCDNVLGGTRILWLDAGHKT